MTHSFPIAVFFGGAPGMSEILLVLAVALMMFGSKRLPEIARTLGRTMQEFRRAARDVTDEIMQVMDDDDTEPGPATKDHLLPTPDEPRKTVEYLPPERRRCEEQGETEDEA